MKGYAWHVQIIRPARQKFVYSTLEDFEYAMRVFKVSAPSLEYLKAGPVEVFNEDFRMEISYKPKDSRGTVINAWTTD